MRISRLSTIAVLFISAGICFAADEMEVGLSGQRMHVNPARRGVNGATPYARAGEVAVGHLSVKSANAKKEKDADLGLRVLDVATEIDGLSARTTVTHVFENATDEILEGVFTFAMPSGSAVDRFAMTIKTDSDLMEGELVEKGYAKRVYNNLVYGVGMDPGVLEWLDGNIFRATIFPIQPQARKTIVVSYLETLTPQFCSNTLTTTYRYPLFQRGDVKAMPPASQVQLHTVIRNAPAGTTVSATLNPRVQPGANGMFTLSAVIDGEVATPEDWAITLQHKAPQAPAKAPAGAAVAADPNACIFRAFRPDTKSDGAYALTLIPDAPNDGQPKDVDVIFMLDTSSSRSSASMAASCELIRAGIEALNLDDRFALVCFDVTTRVLPGGLQQPFERNVDHAKEMLKTSLPLGATDVAGAFKTVEELFARTARAHTYVIYLGDADASYGETDMDAVRKQAEQSLRALHADMFAVYGGTRKSGDVNLVQQYARGLEALGKFSGGPVLELTPSLRPSDAGRTLIHSLGAPVLSHAKLEVTTDDGAAIDSSPGIVGGLTLDRAYTTFGRFTKNGSAKVVLSGTLHGEEYRRAWTVEFPKQENANGTIEKLWARARIGQLNASGDRQSADEAMRLALRHGILSQNTAFLVLESEQMYSDYKIAHTDRRPDAGELRSRMLAGTAMPLESAPGFDPADALTAAQSMRIAAKPPLANSMAGAPIQIGDTKVKLSLQDVKIVERAEKFKAGDAILTHRQAFERRMGLTRLIAAERGLPFEPETVFPKIWLEAINSKLSPVNTFANNELTTAGKRDDTSLADIRVWTEVQRQPAAAPTWRSKMAQPDAIEDQVDHLLNTDKPSQIKIADDNSALFVDSHLFAQQILGELLMDNAPQHYKVLGGTSEVMRVISTRRPLTYSLKGIEPLRLSAAYNFLAELALIEHQYDLAGKMAERSIEASEKYTVSGKPVAALSHMILALSAQVSGDYSEASKQYAAMLAGTDPLLKGTHALTYSALVTTMAMGGNADGAVTVLERWCANAYSPEITVRLGEAYQLAHRRDDAIRALSIPVEFGQESGKDYPRPEDFLKKTRKH